MKTSNLMKATLLFSACFVTVAILLAHEFTTKSLSSRGLAIGMIFLSGLVCFGLLPTLLLARRNEKPMARSSDAETVAHLDTMVRKKRTRAVGIGKIFVVVLILALINGLRYVGKVPAWVLLVGITINLVLIASIVWIVVQAQRSLK